jgi:hypothetical protein
MTQTEDHTVHQADTPDTAGTLKVAIGLVALTNHALSRSARASQGSDAARNSEG